jgi:hypothetical protein
VTGLLDAAGIDARQWWALTRVFVRADFGPLRGLVGSAHGRRAALGLALSVIFYGLAGGAIGLLALSSPDLLLSGAILSTYVAFLVAANVLLTHTGTIVSPDDHAILGFRPVTSRTYMAVRVTTILVHTLITAVLLGLLPVGEFAFAHGLAVGTAVAATVLVTAVAATLTIVAAYAGLLNLIGPARLARFLSYTQLVASATIYFGLAGFSQSSLRRLLNGVHLARDPWVLLYPGIWFGSYLELGAGHADGFVLGAALTSVVAMVALIWALAGKLSLAYSERLAAIATTSAARHAVGPRSRRRLPFFARGEARAIALLVGSQFRHDNRFRLGVLTFVPLTLFYLYTGTREGPIADPFVVGHGSAGTTMFLQVVLYFLPASLKQLVTASDAYRASWIFHATPADRTRLVLAARNVISIFVVGPYLVCLGIFFAWSFGSVLHAALHVVFLGLMSQIVFQVIVLMDPRLPFADPPNRSRDSGALFGVMTVTMFGGIALYWAVTGLVYPSPRLTAVTLGTLLTTVWGLDRLTRVRIAATVDDLAYLA